MEGFDQNEDILSCQPKSRSITDGCKNVAAHTGAQSRYWDSIELIKRLLAFYRSGQSIRGWRLVTRCGSSDWPISLSARGALNMLGFWNFICITEDGNMKYRNDRRAHKIIPSKKL